MGMSEVAWPLQGNEFSYYMLMASSFILNHSERAQQWTLFPYALASCNQPSTAAQLRAVRPPLHAWSVSLGSCVPGVGHRSCLATAGPSTGVAVPTALPIKQLCPYGQRLCIIGVMGGLPSDLYAAGFRTHENLMSRMWRRTPRATEAHPLQVAVPDALPGDGLPGPGLLGMCGGDFVEVYSACDNAGRFDCVATCFFMDTAHNIINYMQTIYHTLKVGPLLNHFMSQ